MTNSRRLIKISLASPGDVIHERNVVPTVIDELNRTVAKANGLILEIFKWETGSRPSMKPPQEAINSFAGNMADFDLFVGIMWCRFGTPTPNAESGTEEEFDMAVAAFRASGCPEVWVYFGQQPSRPKSSVDAMQLAKVLGFREQLQHGALPFDFEDTLDFERKLREHLTAWILSFSTKVPTLPELEPTEVRAAARVSVVDTQVVSDSGLWLLLHQSFLLAESAEQTESQIRLTIQAKNASEDAAIRLITEAKQPLAFAHGNDACIVSFSSGVKETTHIGALWKLNLAIKDHFEGNPSMEIATSGLNPDQIAERRARLILLNENPVKGRDGKQLEMDPKKTMLFVMTSGVNTPIRVERGVLPDLAQELDTNPSDFLRLARLSAILYLRGSITVAAVQHLEMEMVDPSHVRIAFRGQRPKFYSNVEPHIISVDGMCDLNS